MTREEELEAELARWLAATARPMPPELLEEVVAEIPRTRRPGVTGRFGGGWRTFVPGVTLVGVLVVALGIAILQRPATPGMQPSGGASPSVVPEVRTWDPFADYARDDAHANPGPDGYGNAGVWSYRFAEPEAHDPGAAPLLTTFEAQDDRWLVAGFDKLHAYPTTAGVILHPWEAAGDARTAILAWTSPTGGGVSVRGTFRLANRPCAVNPADPVELAIVQDGSTIWSETLAEGSTSFELHRVAQPGTTLSFVVGPAANSNCDSTELILRIETE